MPNWASTNFRFFGNREELERLKAFFKKWNRVESIVNDFHEGWLGNLLCGCLIDTGEATPETIQDVYQNMDLPYHRGSVVWTEDLGDELDVETETAWNAMPQVFDFIISRLGLEEISYVYMEEELGCCIYQTNDTDGIVWGPEFDYYVNIDLDGEDRKPLLGRMETTIQDTMDEDGFVNLACDILQLPVPETITEEFAVSLVDQMNSNEWKDDNTFVSIQKLERISS